MPQPIGDRPLLLISREEAYVVRSAFTTAIVTSRIRQIDAEVVLGPEDGMPKRCAVNLDTLQTVSRSQLRRRITSLSDDTMQRVDDALRFALGLD